MRGAFRFLPTLRGGHPFWSQVMSVAPEGWQGKGHPLWMHTKEALPTMRRMGTYWHKDSNYYRE